MRRTRVPLLAALALLAAWLLACGGGEAAQELVGAGRRVVARAAGLAGGAVADRPADAAAPSRPAADGPVLFTIGVHVEPFGATVSERVGESGAASQEQGARRDDDDARRRPSARPGRRPGARGRRPGHRAPPRAGRGRPPRGKAGARGGRRAGRDYTDPEFFRRHVEDIEHLLEVVEKHGGRVVVQAQTPFSTMLAKEGSDLFRRAESAGHEVALHFHEDAHLGPDFTRLPASTWTAVMRDEIEELRRAGATRVRYWSGGNLFPEIIRAGADAGLEVTGDYKSRYLQAQDPRLLLPNPWRPHRGTDGRHVDDFVKHDPSGPVVYVPDGPFDVVYAKKAVEGKGGRRRDPAPVLEVFARAVRAAVEARDPDRVDVVHVTIHPGEITGADPAHPYAELDAWLSEVVDPLVESGKLRWATFSEMADAYREWERAHPDIPPRPDGLSVAGAAPAGTARQGGDPARPERRPAPAAGSGPFVQFAINVHDWRHPDESAATLLRLVDIFERHGVRGDFYLTAPMVHLYAERHPEVIDRLRSAGMGIGYHVRAPHPLASGFGEDLPRLSDAELERTLRDYETYRLDLRTGELDRSQPGGYRYVADTFGRPPVVVAAHHRDRRVRRAALRTYRELGARMVVGREHEAFSDPSDPFEWQEGLLVRPSTIGLTRWKDERGRDIFWWNGVQRDPDGWDPARRLESELARAGGGTQFVTALIHENNFYRSRETPWARVYYREFSTGRRVAKSPPFDLDAEDRSVPRSKREQERIWAAWTRLVAWSAVHGRVVTAEDVVGMAGAAR